MDTNRRIVAAPELILIFPSALFMTAVVSRRLPPLQSAARRIVTWYSVRCWTLIDRLRNAPSPDMIGTT